LWNTNNGLNEIIKTPELSITQKEAVIKLWNREYPRSVMHETTASFDDYLHKRKDKTHFLLADDLQSIVGWAVLFERDNGRWFALLVDTVVQGKGYGTALLTKLKENERILHGWAVDANDVPKVNGKLYK
jgi:GNAT superfamily N-acetyltransferase